jgi:hypothetical protein
MLVLTAGSVMTFFEGDFARIGRLTSLFFAPGIVAVFLAPDTARKDLE